MNGLILIIVILLGAWLCMSKSEGFHGQSDSELVCFDNACWMATQQKCDKIKLHLKPGQPIVCPKGYKVHGRCYNGQDCYCYKCSPKGRQLGP